MDLTSQAPVGDSVKQPPPKAAYVSAVDPFLVEALQNPRHRLTRLPDLHQFEFPHFPTSYLRLAAHRVAQNYGLQIIVDGQGIRITVIKKPESKFPVVCLSEIPANDLENNKLDQIKIVIRPRPKASSRDAGMLGLKDGQVRTVEERREEYDRARARARIFNRPNNSDWEDSIDRASSNGTNFHVNDNYSRVAFLRDREKDRTNLITTVVMTDMSRTSQQLRILVWRLLICRNFSLHFSSMIHFTHKLVRYILNKLLWTLRPHL
ncbi:Single-stranded nucleic acid binding R3H protein [Striga hermonthica]|uniref:Single-stranded nucleic acid binding R3H protein n=1 Tax=Striga hermonthica TaxID=68872 RepID=A0A9N7MTR6_STRHE|nr:Single-stranded nucleic acid binding R3H protein [Striga hermonthica]